MRKKLYYSSIISMIILLSLYVPIYAEYYVPSPTGDVSFGTGLVNTSGVVTTNDGEINHNTLYNYSATRHFLKSDISHNDITGTGTYSHTSIDAHINDTVPYIAQNTGTGTGITLAGNTNFPSGIWNSSGNAGFGTTTPATAVHVIGTVTVSSGIIVSGSTMTVPDYVFAEDYKLLPIEELKEFVSVNQHLPEFESAKNTTQLNLVQDNMRLREAIEKLTLYLFEMKQEIADLRGANQK